MNHDSSPFNLSEKTVAVLGVADRESLAWAIARSFSRAGAKVTIGYQQKFFSRVRLLLDEEPNIVGARCEITNSDEVERFFEKFEETGLDTLVHSIAYGSPAIFTQSPSQVRSVDFSETMEISTHSLAKVVSYAHPYLKPWGSVMTLSFQASEKAMPLYGMMGVAKAALESLVRYLAIELGKDRIRINAISAGPIETLAALAEMIALRRDPEAIQKLPATLLATMLKEAPKELSSEEDELQFAKRCWEVIQNGFAQRSAIPEKLVAEDIANMSMFLASDASKKITGQVLHVDCGFSACQIL